MVQARYAVVIVTYNREQLLRECVRQVENQTVPADQVILVNNASTDGTGTFLKELSAGKKSWQVIECPENIGGAGGFAKGIARAAAYDVDCVLMIDDDAILAADYMENLLNARKQHPSYGAFAGCVKVDGKIDTCHRKNVSGAGILLADCPLSLYQKACFECTVASFCGMLVDLKIIRKIGLPLAEYFIWHDDAEYSLRIHKYTSFLVVPDAVLNHKTVPAQASPYPRRYEWRDYYSIRNRILMLREHGSPLDRIINFSDLFLRVIFRNWLFGIIKADHYDWKYEKDMVKKAWKDANRMQIGQVKLWNCSG